MSTAILSYNEANRLTSSWYPSPTYSSSYQANNTTSTSTTTSPPMNNATILQYANQQQQQSTETLPQYSPTDIHATTFSLHGTIIHTAHGPTYHLSSSLSTPSPRLLLRRLLPEEMYALRHVSPSETDDLELPFLKHDALFEIHAPPLLEREVYVHPTTSEALHLGPLLGPQPGILRLRFGLRRWHVALVGAEGGVGNGLHVLTCGKAGTLTKKLVERRNERVGSEWKDCTGRVVASEVPRRGGQSGVNAERQEGVPRKGSIVSTRASTGEERIPTMEICADLEHEQREVLVAVWIARLWAAVGKREVSFG